jgi:hypothetical protein
MLDQSKEFGEEIGDEECVRKNQCPIGDSLRIDLYCSPPFCFSNTENFFTAHRLLHGKPRTYQSSNLLFTTLKNVKPPKMTRKMINKLEKAN